MNIVSHNVILLDSLLSCNTFIVVFYFDSCVTVECSGENYVKCNSSARCISVSWICDGDADCVDGEDERNCTGRKMMKVKVTGQGHFLTK